MRAREKKKNARGNASLEHCSKESKKKIYARRLFAKYLNVVVRRAESKGKKKESVSEIAKQKVHDPRQKVRAFVVFKTLSRGVHVQRATRCDAKHWKARSKKKKK